MDDRAARSGWLVFGRAKKSGTRASARLGVAAAPPGRRRRRRFHLRGRRSLR